MASQSRKDQRVWLSVVIRFVAWGLSQQGLGHVKSAWKIERTSFVERRNYFTSVNKNLRMKVLVIFPNMGSFLSSFFVEYFYFRLSSATHTFTETP
ncbi:hypothetical protein NL676_000985 [Syzygium grande]|nr:hypothetical protein NL676_000985 [Syzygium grande]